MTERIICHIAERDAWRQAERTGSYAPPSLASEGFLHCSKPDQILDVANQFFCGRRDLVLLVIDEARVAADLRYEPPADGSGRPEPLFPHLYGSLDRSAVLEAVEFSPGEDGTFTLPDLSALIRRARP